MPQLLFVTQAAMNKMFAKHLNKSKQVYMDDLLVFSKNAEEHEFT